MNGRRARARRRQEPGCAEPLIISPSRADVRAAVEQLPADMSWTSMSDALRPVFIRRRPLPPGAERPITVRRPPGMEIAIGLDIGPAFLYVTQAWLDDWGIGFDEAFERAAENLRAAIRAETYLEMEYETIGGVPFWWYQSRSGLASGLLLVEDELTRRYGDEPRLLIAPMRNLLLAAPFDADREVVEWLRDEISHEDPNGLDLPVFALVDGRLSIDGRSAARRRAMVH